MNMRKVPGTEIRGGIYHLKKRVPKELQSIIGRELVRKSLKTGDPYEAARKVRELECEWDGLRDAIISDERRVQLMSRLPPHQKAMLEDVGGFDQLMAEFKRSTQARNFMIAGDPATINDELTDDPNKSDLERRMIRAGNGAEHAAELNELEMHMTTEGKVLQALGEDVKLPLGTFGMNELAEAFIDAKESSPTTAETVRYVVRRFVELHGDIPITDMKNAHLRKYAEKIIRVPISTSPSLRKLSILEAIKWAEIEGAKTIGERTLGSHIAHLKSLTAFATPQGYLETDPFSAFKTVRRRTKFSKDAGSRRLPLSSEQITSILDYCDEAFHPETIDYWAPIIAAYQGARREEIGQLLENNIHDIEGVICFSFTDEGDGQTIKSKASVRMVPVHPKILQRGFLAVVENRRATGGGLLFQYAPRWGKQLQTLKPDARGRLTETYGKRFSRMLRKNLNITDDRYVFHSFRHSWQDAANAANIKDSHRRILAGRSALDPVESGYGEGPSKADLLKSLEQIDPLS